MNEIGNIQNKNFKGHLSKHINVNMRVFIFAFLNLQIVEKTLEV